MSFLLRSVYDVLPTPTNLQRWDLIESPKCQLCGERATFAHILSGCKVALQQGRYRWRHDRVLRALADILEKERKNAKQEKTKRTTRIAFVRAGEHVKPSKTEKECLLEGSTWQMKVDLRRKFVFPDVVQTTQRPDIVLWSADKRIIIIELTVPWEECCDEAHERKSAMYWELKELCNQIGWKTTLFPAEVGCRGFLSQSVWKLLKALGISGSNKRRALRILGEEAERSSSWIWFRRDSREWKSQDTQ